MSPTGTLTFKASSSSDDMSVSIDTITCFIGQIGEKYSFKKKPNNQKNPKLGQPTINEVMESTTTNGNCPACEEPLTNATDKMTY